MSDMPNGEKADQRLDELIRACRGGEKAAGFVRPSGDAITAYLLGTATDDQKRAVNKALIHSKEFRREILEMSTDIEVLASMDLTPSEEDSQQVPVPSREEFEKQHKQDSPILSKLKVFWERLVEFRIPQLYVPALATATVLILVAIQTTLYLTHKKPQAELERVKKVEVKGIAHTLKWSLIPKQLDRGYLSSNVPRSAESKSGKNPAYSDPQEAASMEFGNLVKYEKGLFLFKPAVKKPEPISLSRSIVLRLVDSSGSLIQEFPAYVPVTRAGSSEPVTAWLLGLPSTNLYTVEMTSDTLNVLWTRGLDAKGCVTFTYFDGKKYRAVMGFTFDLHK